MRRAVPIPAQFTRMRAAPCCATHVVERRRYAVGVGDVARRGDAADLGRDRFRACGVAVENADLRAERGEPPRGRGAEPRRAAA